MQGVACFQLLLSLFAQQTASYTQLRQINSTFSGVVLSMFVVAKAIWCGLVGFNRETRSGMARHKLTLSSGQLAVQLQGKFRKEVKRICQYHPSRKSSRLPVFPSLFLNSFSLPLPLSLLLQVPTPACSW